MINLSRIIRDGGRIVATSALLLASSSVADLCCGRADRPQISPACHPTWGYYQTCWRRFPPLEPCVGWGDTCDVCPPQGTVIHQGQPVQGPVRIIGPQLQTHPHMKMGQPPVILQPFGGGWSCQSDTTRSDCYSSESIASTNSSDCASAGTSGNSGPCPAAGQTAH